MDKKVVGRRGAPRDTAVVLLAGRLGFAGKAAAGRSVPVRVHVCLCAGDCAQCVGGAGDRERPAASRGRRRSAQPLWCCRKPFEQSGPSVRCAAAADSARQPAVTGCEAGCARGWRSCSPPGASAPQKHTCATWKGRELGKLVVVGKDAFDANLDRVGSKGQCPLSSPPLSLKKKN